MVTTISVDMIRHQISHNGEPRFAKQMTVASMEQGKTYVISEQAQTELFCWISSYENFIY